jgi:hypothetical protein
MYETGDATPCASALAAAPDVGAGGDAREHAATANANANARPDARIIQEARLAGGCGRAHAPLSR